MKQIAISIFLVASILCYSQHTKKKVYKKPVKKSYAKKKAVAMPETTGILNDESKDDTTDLKPTQAVTALTTQEPIKAEPVPVEKVDYEKTAEKILKQKGWINNRNSALVRGVEGFVKGVYSGNGKIFVLIEVNNRSNINYDIQNISFITSPSKKKNKGIDTEEKLFIPIWSNQPDTITKKATQRMVFVFDKFTIAENKTLNAVVNENEGERNLTLEIKPTYILGAEYIN